VGRDDFLTESIVGFFNDRFEELAEKGTDEAEHLPGHIAFFDGNDRHRLCSGVPEMLSASEAAISAAR